MQETARVWLRCPSNRSVSGFRTVAELYLLHVLVPLGSREEAEELILGEVGRSVFTADQRQTALELLEDKVQPHRSSQNSEPPAEAFSAQGLPGNTHSSDWMREEKRLSDGSVFRRNRALQTRSRAQVLLQEAAVDSLWPVQRAETLHSGDASVHAASAVGSRWEF